MSGLYPIGSFSGIIRVSGLGIPRVLGGANREWVAHIPGLVCG